MADSKALARMFKVLSVPARVRIVQLLKRRSLCVGALARQLGVSDAAVSQHLRVLRDAGLVTDNKRANFVHYSLNARALEAWERATGGLLGGADT